jgi:hypothetical protein
VGLLDASPLSRPEASLPFLQHETLIQGVDAFITFPFKFSGKREIFNTEKSLKSKNGE